MKVFNEETATLKAEKNPKLKHFYVVVGLFNTKSKETKPFRLYTVHVAAEDEPEANDLAFNFCQNHIGILDDEYFDITEESQTIS